MNRGRWVQRWTPLLVILLAGAALRFWRLAELALIGDESYYWLWSRHLDWAYFDHPAGVAVLVRLSTLLGGQGEAGIRWLNALAGVASILLVYLLGERMLSRGAGLFAALLVAVGAPYLLTSRFVYTDALQLFFLLFNLYWFWRLVQEQPRPGWTTAILFGFSLAVLLNTKYSAYLYTLALLVAVLIDHRHLLAERRFWLGMLIAAAGLLPVLVWNAMHDWVSFRWQLSHLGFSLTGESSLLGNLYHSLAYLSWPLLVIALVGLALMFLGRVRRPATRLLALLALILLLPVALSPANSPRNLSSGLVLLLLLAGALWPVAPFPRWQKGLASLLAILAVGATIYGLGTVLDLFGESAWPASSAVQAIRRDAAGWRELGPALSTYPQPVFALDYSIASQIWYYSGQPAYSSWGQYRIWGIPEIQDTTIASLGHLPADLVTARLREAFQHLEGPTYLRAEELGAVKELRVWRAEGLVLDQDAFLHQFDFLTLLEIAE